jgi:hypothetical protein
VQGQKALEALKAIESVKEAQDCMTASLHNCTTINTGQVIQGKREEK